MRNLREVYESYDKGFLGPTAAQEKERKSRLRDALKDVRAGNERYFLIAASLLVAFFVASWVLVYWYRDSPGYLTGIFATLGGSVFGCVWAMARLWHRKVAVDAVLAVLDELPPTEFRIAFKALVDVAFGTRPK
jgi:hypothetical protein